jgi:hypothetical protein
MTNEQIAVLQTLDRMRRAVKHLASQFDVTMTMIEAKSNFEARRTLIVLHNRIINEHKRRLGEPEVSENYGES